MKRMKRQVLTLMMAVMVLFTMMPNTAEAAAKKSVTVSVSTKKLNVKRSAQLKVKYGKKNVTKKAKYKTSNKKVLTVNKKGKVTAKKTGKAIVTVKYKGKTKKVKFTVGKAAHQHKWVKKTRTEKKWVPKIVTVNDYETVYTYIWHCNCGEDIIVSDKNYEEAYEHSMKHVLAGEDDGGYSETIEEKKVVIGSHQEDHGRYKDVPCGTYYQCACGAVK